MDRLEKKFKSGDVLRAEELNGVVGKINELVDSFEDSLVKTLTQKEYDQLPQKDMQFYVVVEKKRVMRIYIGPQLIAMRKNEAGSTNFPYDFPIIF